MWYSLRDCELDLGTSRLWVLLDSKFVYKTVKTFFFCSDINFIRSISSSYNHHHHLECVLNAQMVRFDSLSTRSSFSHISLALKLTRPKWWEVAIKYILYFMLLLLMQCEKVPSWVRKRWWKKLSRVIDWNYKIVKG